MRTQPEKADKQRKQGKSADQRKQAPAKTLEGREKQLVALAMDVAEEQMRRGTASSQIITNFLKLGSVQAQLEVERRRHENDLLVAKTEAIRSAKSQEELYEKAIRAMNRYNGRDTSGDEYED